jgi:thiol-disulfide isomerase/thioredoxin
MFNRIVLFSCFLFVYGSSISQTVISGTAKGAEGRTVKVLTVADYITHKPLYLACDTISKDGEFYLDFNITNSCSVKLEIDYYQTFVYAVPGMRISLDFLAFDYHLAEKVNCFWESEQIPDLMYAVSYSDSSFFLFKNDSGYLTKMNRYRLAKYEEATGKMNRKALFENYIESVPFSLNNDYFVEFVGDFFNNYFSRFSGKFLLNTTIDNLLDTMGIDPFLRNEMLREYICIKMLYQYVLSVPAHAQAVVMARVKSLLKALSDKTKFNELSRIIDNVLNEWSSVKSFKSMILKDFNGQNILFENLLKDFDAPYFYVGFISANNILCPDCLTETDVLLRIPEKNYKDSVKVILINVDDEFMTYYHDYRTFSSKKSKIPYLYFNRQISLMRSLDAVHFPCYFLLDRTGVILQSDFAKPSDGLESRRPFCRRQQDGQN